MEMQVLPATLTPDSLNIKREYSARADVLWKAWTEPARLKKWFCAPFVTILEAKVDLRVGGAWSIRLRGNKDGAPEVRLWGEYIEVATEKKLSFTWSHDAEDNPASDSVVTVEFESTSTGTNLSLTHEKLPDEKSRDGHLEGWSACLIALDGEG